MTAETFDDRDDWLSRLIVLAGNRIVPRTLKGHLTLDLPSGRRIELGMAGGQPAAVLCLKNWRPLWSSMRRKATGFCESYMAGDWESPDPRAVFHFYLENRPTLDHAARPLFFRSLGDRLWHLLRDNSKTGSKRNIEQHYDLGNDFYRLWLDPTMTYSAAYFGGGSSSLQEAQVAKYDLVLDTLELQPGHSILEIGCGWGGFAEQAVKRGAAVTGITLSRQQLAYARERLGETAAFRLQDYRDTAGQFDRIASIEMIEAVGAAHWRTYFETLYRRLKPGGIAAVQAITIGEAHFARYMRGTDFIQRYVFPGGMLPTKTILAEQAAAAGLDFRPVIAFGKDYARTLSLWREAFEANWRAVAALGFDERFRRRWRLYFDYCETGFSHGMIDVGIYQLRKPQPSNTQAAA